MVFIYIHTLNGSACWSQCTQTRGKFGGDDPTMLVVTVLEDIVELFKNEPTLDAGKKYIFTRLSITIDS